MELIRIKDNVQKTAEAISSVLGVDVTVTDRNLIRIAGTGKYQEHIGEKVSEKGVFGYCLKHSTPYVVRNPKEAEACSACPQKESCMEYAEIVSPIKVEEQVYGIIGLIAFDEMQKKLLLKNEENIMDFLEKIASLVASKLVDKERSSEIKLLVSQLQTIMDVMEKAIIIADKTGKINYFNKKADKLFHIESRKIKNIRILLQETDLNEACNYETELKNREFYYKGQEQIAFRAIMNTKLYFDEKEAVAIAILVNDLQQIISSARNIISANIITEFDNIVYQSKKMENVIDLAKKVSQTDSTVFITGESGTGKELFARAVHYESKRKTEPFIAINCSAIPENLFESELFGYEEGAFTGALRGGHPGKFELAHKGTLLLDEIGDMPLNLQPKLLRVLQDGKVMRVGGKRYVEVDVRIIASTNVNLEEKMRNKEFREDLYYRLHVIPLYIPSLRERKEDIPLIAAYFLKRFSQKLHKNVIGIDSPALDYINQYTWRGNVRELENAIEYAVSMTENEFITISCLAPKIRGYQGQREITKDPQNQETLCTIEELEKREIQKALELHKKTNCGIPMICQELGIGRATLYRKIKKYNLSTDNLS